MYKPPPEYKPLQEKFGVKALWPKISPGACSGLLSEFYGISSRVFFQVFKKRMEHFANLSFKLNMEFFSFLKILHSLPNLRTIFDFITL